jgi:hypothetical protein
MNDKKSTVKKAEAAPKAQAKPKAAPKPKKPSRSLEEIKAEYKKARRKTSAAVKLELEAQFKKDISAL